MNIKTIMILLGMLAVIVLALLTRFQQSRPDPPPQTTPTPPVRHAVSPRLPAPRMPAQAVSAEAQIQVSPPASVLNQILDGKEPAALTLDQVEPYLRDHRRSAESLLAAYRVTNDPALLHEALEKYPHDPQVNYVALFQSRSPEERRQRLEALKTAAADNPLINYLSAQHYFQSGQTDQAVQELIAAAGKRKWRDFAGEFVQSAEEAYLAAGYSSAEAKAAAAYALPLPYLAELRRLGKNMGELADRYRQAGDDASAQATLQMAVNMGRYLSEPAGSSYIIQDLVGVAIERQLLTTLDPASPYDDQGHTVQQRIDELVRYRDAIKEAQGHGVDEILKSLSEQDLATYFDRIKVSGEMAALRWAQQKLGPP